MKLTVKLPFVVAVLLQCFSVFAQTEKVREMVHRHNYREAVQLLQALPETRENGLLKAESYEKLYDFASAIAEYQKLLEQYPDDNELVIALAETTWLSGNPAESLNYWTQANRIAPDNLYLQTKKAVAHYRAEDWPGTIAATEIVFQKDSVALLLRITGEAYKNLNDDVWANFYYTKALEKNPSDYVSLSRICEYYYAMEEAGYDTVLVMTQKYLDEINPNQKTIGQMNGMANYSVGNYDKAIERLQANVELGDNSYTTVYFLGMSHYGKNWYYEAVKWLEKAYAYNRKDVNLYYYYGTALAHTKKREKALEVLQEGVAMIDKMDEMLFDFDISMAEAYLNTNGHGKAVEHYLSAYKRRPSHHNLLYNIAHTYDTAKDYKNAIAYYERFLKTAPKSLDLTTSTLVDEKKISIKDIYYKESYRRMKELQEVLFMRQEK